MDRVSAEFFKNVLLLTKFVEPHDEFKKHFKEDMFDKPNSPGFIHVSFYLLSIHYQKVNVKNKIQWPITCKQTENKFRKDVRECLMTIANENSDVNFPPILASHLLLAKGSKFLLIMWKFSLIVLRTYLQREHNCILTYTPKMGPCVSLTKTFLKKIVTDNDDTISNIRKNRENIQVAKETYQKKKSQEINELKAIILKLKEKLKQIISTAPVNEVAKIRLMNLEDNEIISMWSDSINESIADSQKHNEFFKNIDNRINYIVNIVLNLAGNSLKLNLSSCYKINVEPIYQFVSPEKQVHLYNLYQMGSLNLKNLFSIFHLLLQKYASTVERSEFSKSNLQKCNLQLQMSNKDLKIVINRFQTIQQEIRNFTISHNQTYKLKKDKSKQHRTVSNINFEFDKVLFMPSPPIQINSFKGQHDNIQQNYLQLTPTEGTHKQLFSRHAIDSEKDVYSMKKKPMPVMQINFDDSTLYETSTDKLSKTQQRFNKPLKLQKFNFKNADKYSKIFSPLKPNDNRVNKSRMMIMPSTENSMLPLTPKQHYMQLVDSYNSSKELFQEPLLMNPILNSTSDLVKPEEENISQKNNKRRSIGDLVERYKKLLQKNDVNSQEKLDSTTEFSGEESVL